MKFVFIKHNISLDIDSTTMMKTKVSFVRVAVPQEDTFSCVKLKFGGLERPEVRKARTPKGFEK